MNHNVKTGIAEINLNILLAVLFIDSHSYDTVGGPIYRFALRVLIGNL